MNEMYSAALQQIETADIAASIYRTARRLLDLAAQHDGYIEVAPEALVTMRCHLDRLRRLNIIECQISDKHGWIVVGFTAWARPRQTGVMDK